MPTCTQPELVPARSGATPPTARRQSSVVQAAPATGRSCSANIPSTTKAPAGGTWPFLVSSRASFMSLTPPVVAPKSPLGLPALGDPDPGEVAIVGPPMAPGEEAHPANSIEKTRIPVAAARPLACMKVIPPRPRAAKCTRCAAPATTRFRAFGCDGPHGFATAESGPVVRPPIANQHRLRGIYQW